MGWTAAQDSVEYNRALADVQSAALDLADLLSGVSVSDGGSGVTHRFEIQGTDHHVQLEVFDGLQDVFFIGDVKMALDLRSVLEEDDYGTFSVIADFNHERTLAQHR